MSFPQEQPMNLNRLSGSPMEIVQELMAQSRFTSELTLQQYMDDVSSRFEDSVRTSSPSEFIEDLVKLGVLFRKDDGLYFVVT